MALHKTETDLLNGPHDETRLQYEETCLKAAQIQAQLTTLTAEHAELVEAVLGYEASFAPWKLIPDEVLQRIFQWTKSAEPPTCVPFSRTVGPMQLTQVCSKWRALAHDTPTIWQGLKCSLYLPPDRYERQETIAFIHSWLSRAAYLPLLIVAVPLDLGPGILPMGVRAQMAYQAMHGSNTGAGAPFPPWLLVGNKFNLIKDVIIPNTHRIRDLHITFPPYYRHTLALLQETVDFPLLEDVVLDFDNDVLRFSPPTLSLTYTLLQNAPRLRKFKFGSFKMINHTQIFVNWSNLTHFEAQSMSPTTFTRIMAQMTSLQYCKASLDSFDFVPHAGAPVNHIPGPGQLLWPPHQAPLAPNVPPNAPNVPNLAPNVANVPNLPALPNIANPPNIPVPPNPNPPPAPNAPVQNPVHIQNFFFGNVPIPPINPPNAPNPMGFPHYFPQNVPGFIQNLQNALNVAGVLPGPLGPGPPPGPPGPPAASILPIIHIPSLHTLDLTTSYRPMMPQPHEPLDNFEFPNLKILSLTSTEWPSLTRTFFRTATSLSELHLKITGPFQRNVLQDILNNPVLSGLTHFSIRVRDTRFLGPRMDTIDEETMNAIAEGGMLPQLHTLEFEGYMQLPSLVHLLVTKGFVSKTSNTDDVEEEVIYPDVGQEQSGRPAGGSPAVPFQKVKLYRCQPDFVTDPVLVKIQELVGTDRFTMEASDVEQWERMNQIDWNTDE
ncbi:hypothetical protein BDN72DRAFT_848746 [Pluteus cervinus]|uniref:Uncharacterized protein n=1 Tax=Pluteus cervinus TaxID=181527 RepID=A0ACD3A9H3_9AGAR|nr:hypothetical protein BDN72DRAFT_848746 [Pluteus cervinus]